MSKSTRSGVYESAPEEKENLVRNLWLGVPAAFYLIVAIGMFKADGLNAIGVLIIIGVVLAVFAWAGITLANRNDDK